MAEGYRAELLSAISKNDVEGLSKISNKLFSLKILDDTIDALNKRQKSDLWDAVLAMCTATLLGSDNDETEGAEAAANMQNLLQLTARLASATLLSLVPTKKDDEEDDDESDNNGPQSVEVPPSLHETAIILHEILPTLKSERSGIKNTLSQLFESWWTNGFQGKEELVANTILYLLERSTQSDSAKTDVGRVMALHNVLLAVDLSKESSAPLVNLLLQCGHHPQYVNSPQGVQFLSFLFSLNQDMAQHLHNTIKVHLPSVPGSWGTIYGDIYYRAWQKSSPEQREYLEQHCIQDIMLNACRLKPGPKNSLWNVLFNILSSLHAKKTQRDVLDMLTRLYGPILWRCFSACNSDVRLSALKIFFDAFPLANSAQTGEEADQFLQKQLNVMHRMLRDPVPVVRLTATTGIGKVLAIYWELIPSDVIKCFMTELVETQVYDSTTPALREAVIVVMNRLVGNHLAAPYLEKVLPSIGNFAHDKCESVRLGMLDLLLRIKGVRCGIKFYRIVPVQHLLARLEIETCKDVSEKIVELLVRSFVPPQDKPQERIERVKALVLSNPGAAREFFMGLPDALPISECVHYIVLLCRYLIEAARQLNAEGNTSVSESTNNESRSGADKETAQKGSDTRRKSLRSSGKKSKMAASQEQVADEESNEACNEDREVRNATTILRGIAEGIYLMYLKIQPDLLEINAFRPMSEGMAKKLCVTVREIMAVSQDPELDKAMISLAGLLPSQALPLISQSLMKRLQKCGPAGGEGKMDMTCVIKALVQWRKAPVLVEALRESFDKAYSDIDLSNEAEEDCDADAENVRPTSSKKGKRRKKKTVGFSADVEEDVLPIKVAMEATEVLLVQPECRRILAMRHRDLLRPLAASLGAAIKKLGDILSPSAPEWFVQDSFSFFTGGQSSPVAVYMKFYELHLRLCAFLSLPGVQTDALSVPLKTEEERALVTALTWCTTNLLPWLKSTARAQKCSSNQVGACSSKASKGTRGKSDDSIETFLEEKRQVLLYLLTVTLKVASNVLMASCVDCTLLDEAVQLCVSLLQCLNSAGTDTLNIPVVSATLRCVYHILSVRMKQDEGQEDLQEKPRETMSKRAKCADIACSCLRLLFKALTDPPAPQEAAEIAGNLEAGMASMDIGEGETEEKRQSIEHSHIESQRSELVKAIASTVSELIVELTKPGQTISVSDKVASMSFRCVLADLERASESSEDLCDPEETKLPPVSTMVLAALKKRAVTVKLFCAELEQCLAGDEVFNIYQAMALVTMVQELKSRDPVLQTPVIYQALKGKVAGASKPAQMDEKDFQALMSKAETTLKHMRSELLGDA